MPLCHTNCSTLGISLIHIDTVQQDVDTVLLDMGDTLLDLVFDNYFWQKLVPEIWGVKSGVTPRETMEYMRQ